MMQVLLIPGIRTKKETSPMVGLKPRSYQKTAYRRAVKALDDGKNVLVVSPGGSGKTLMMSMLTKYFLRQGKTVLWLAHRKELLEQAKSHLIRYGVSPKRIGLVTGEKTDLPTFRRVLLASVQTFSKRDLKIADVVLIDEGHHAPARSYQDIVSQCARGAVAGFTATPTRLDGVGLVGTYDEMVEAAKVSRLIRKGYVARVTCFSPAEALIPDLRAVRARGRAGNRDFDRTDLEREVDKPELVGNIVEHYKKHAKNKQAILFAVSIKHADHIADRFKEEGISAEVLHGGLSQAQRDLVLGRFKSRTTTVLCTCDLANEGLDIPAVRVAIFARPTQSFTVYMQQAARVMRPGPKSTILDHAGNVIRFGLPDIDRTYGLDGVLDEVPEAAQVKKCPECGCLVPCGEMTCLGCGYAFPNPARRQLLEEGEGELLAMNRNAFLRRLRALAKKKAKGEKWVQQVMEKYKEQLETG
jgi:DNA repair protein RadD